MGLLGYLATPGVDEMDLPGGPLGATTYTRPLSPAQTDFLIRYVIPGTSDAQSAIDALSANRKATDDVLAGRFGAAAGNYADALASGLGAIPPLPPIAGVLKATGRESVAAWKALRDALLSSNTGDIAFGQLSKKKFDQINQVRQGLGVPLLTSRELIIPGRIVDKLREKRIGLDGKTADQVADLVYSVFHSGDSKVLPTRFDDTQRLLKAEPDLSSVGFVSQNPVSGETIIRSAYDKKTRRLKGGLK
jgi:hypothetical protein